MELTKNKKLVTGALVGVTCVVGGYLLYNHYSKKAAKAGLRDPFYDEHVNLKYEDCESRFENIENVNYNLQLSIPKTKRFYGKQIVSFDLKNPDLDNLHLDFGGDQIYSIKVNGCDISYGYKFEHHKLPIPVEKLKAKGNEVEILFTNKYNRTGCGLHKYTDPADEEQYLYTQFECPYCHTFMPCFDQPSLKAVLTLEIIAPTNWIVIANSPATVVDTSPIEQIALLTSPFKGSKYKLWSCSPTYRISTYLYALCAGNFFVQNPDPSLELVTPMRLMCRQSYKQYLTKDYANEWFEVSNHGLKFHGELMGMKYPYDKMDHVICPEYNWGAMENVGCITYYEGYLFKTTPTRNKILRVHCTILHELAHQWYGNLVTMHWWQDLWLNESFATFVAMLAQREYKDEGEGAEIEFLGETVWGIFTDQRETTHPIANEAKTVFDTEVTETIFDGISYGKGGSWLKQLYKYVGKPIFKNGVQRYMAKHCGGSTVLNDFIDAMNIAALDDAKKNEKEPIEIIKWANKWLSEKGVMLLSADIALDSNDKIKQFVVEQGFAKYADEQFKSHKMDIIVYDKEMKATKKEVLIQAESKTDLTKEFADLECGAVMLNSGCHSYVKVSLDPKWVMFLVENFSKLDNFDKNYLAAIMYDMVRDGKLNPILFVKSVVQNILKEDMVVILQNSLGRANTVTRHFVHPKYRDQYSILLFNALLDALKNITSSQAERKTLLASQILGLLNTEENLRKAKDWLEEGNIEGKHDLEKPQKRSILVQLCGATWLSETEKDELVAKYIGDDQDSDAKKALKKCEVARPLKDNKEKWWDWIINVPDGVSQDQYGQVCQAFTIGLSPELGKTFAESYFKNLPLLFKGKGQYYARQFCGNLYPGNANPSPEYLEKLEEVLEENKKDGAGCDKFLKIQGCSLLDIWQRFQSGWEISDPKIWS